MSVRMRLPITVIGKDGSTEKVMAVIYADRPADHEPIQEEAVWASDTVDME
jgi:hypothetical protein